MTLFYNFRPSERYYVESPDGCQLYTMLVDQICRQLEHTALIEEAALPQKRWVKILIIKY